MGQYFLLVNVDKRQFISLGKLAEGVMAKLGLLQYLARIPSSNSDIGSWAGSRLITAGDYIQECPEGMLTKEEEKELNEWRGQQSISSSFYEFVEENFSRYSVQEHPNRPDGQGTFILRNLSKQVYVNEKDFLFYQWNKGVQSVWDFDQLILINTAWSADPSCTMADPLGFDIIPGPWAGDQFDIVMLEKVDVEYWEDVTIQEAERMAKIVKAQDPHSF